MYSLGVAAGSAIITPKHSLDDSQLWFGTTLNERYPQEVEDDVDRLQTCKHACGEAANDRV
jgi:hypothetical protein